MKLKDLTEKDAIHCSTKDEYRKVLEIAHYSNLKWSNGESFLNSSNYWETFKENTIVMVKNGTYGDLNQYLKAKNEYEKIHPGGPQISKLITAEDFILDNILDLPSLKENYKEPEKIVFKDKEWLYCEGNYYPFIIKYKSGGNGERFQSYENYGINKEFEFPILDEKFDSKTDSEMYVNHATEEQITKILGKVAKLKGYKVGTEITIPSNSSIKANEETIILNKEKVYNMENDELTLGGIVVYSKGEWAKLKYPIKQKLPKAMQSPHEIMEVLKKLIR